MKKITNKYAGTCDCGSSVAPGAGFAVLAAPGAKGKWAVQCVRCNTGSEPTPAPATTPLAERPTFPLTDEQTTAVAAFLRGDSIAIQAGAGTGKTSTLVAIANATTRRGQYVAFNKAIVVEASTKLPPSCAASTAHSLAYQQVGKKYRHRLDSARMPSSAIAKHLRLAPFHWQFGSKSHTVQPTILAAYVMKAIDRFCNSADKVPSVEHHFPYVDGVDAPNPETGARTYKQNDRIRRHCAGALAAAWSDIVSVDGILRFNPDHYLKVWELGIHGAPVVPGDYILWDEAQDASPVMLSVIEQQAKQVVFVGDAQQAIYEWRGAVDAMSTVPAESTCYLTNSFRFGQGIADAANAILATIDGAELRLVGRGQPSVVEACDDPDAILCRSNAGAIRVVLSLMEAGRLAHLVGGAADVERFARAAERLMAGPTTVDHPELGIFSTWKQVQDYVAFDPSGSDLKLLVKLIDDFGPAAIIRAVASGVSEEEADVVVSTAHKSKGREWDSVRVHSDFAEPGDSDEERRLMYVAVTRARVHLDIENCAPVVAIVFPARAGANVGPR